MIAIQDHGTNESSLETLPLFGAIKRRKFLKICCNLIDTNRILNSLRLMKIRLRSLTVVLKAERSLY